MPVEAKHLPATRPVQILPKLGGRLPYPDQRAPRLAAPSPPAPRLSPSYSAKPSARLLSRTPSLNLLTHYSSQSRPLSPGAPEPPPPPLPSPGRAGCGRQDPTFPHYPVSMVPSCAAGTPSHTHLVLGGGVLRVGEQISASDPHGRRRCLFPAPSTHRLQSAISWRRRDAQAAIAPPRANHRPLLGSVTTPTRGRQRLALVPPPRPS